MARDMNGPLVALTLQPEDDPVPPASPFSDGDIAVFAAFIVIIAAVLGFDMIRTWWNTNEWRRRPRRRRRPVR
ncbi:MAG TPA: hypothetical protein VGJ29_02190 [Vicinamibacterales bacterium]|jgi:hypothetical protein